MRQPQHIPTIIALFLLLVGLGSTVFLTEQIQQFSAKASQSSNPEEIQITNVADTSFSVSWTTQDKATGSLSFHAPGGTKQLALDDRDGNAPQQYTTHHITVVDLTPETTYDVTIISNGKSFGAGNQSYRIKTAQAVGGVSNPPPPLYGIIKTADDQPAAGTLVYFSTPATQVVSTIAGSDGRFVLPVGSIREQNLARIVTLTPETAGDITMRGPDNSTSTIKTILKNTAPLPSITLGKTYDFRNLEGGVFSVIAGFMKKVMTALVPYAYAASIDILQPTQDSGIPSNKPLFKGTGIANKQVIATVGNPVQIGKLWVDTEGIWSWTPSDPLPPEKYILTITTFDETDKPVALSRTFTILKSGTSVLDAATPSATIKPSPTASVSASPQPIPITGSTAPTYLVLMLGGFFLFLATTILVL